MSAAADTPGADASGTGAPARDEGGAGGASPRLDAAQIREHLRAAGTRWGQPLTVLAETASTNDDARRAATKGAAHGAAFVADAQRAGRGRGAHRWHSPAGCNIYLSLLLRPQVKPGALSPLTLAVGVAVADVVDAQLPAPAARIKWPNDVLVGTRKLAGVLVESSMRARPCGGAEVSLVVGVGLNVHVTRFPAELADIATSLQLEGARAPDRNRLIAQLIGAIEARAERFFAEGLAPLLPSYRPRDALRGRQVTVGALSGRCEGLDEGGQLLLRDGAGQLHAICSGEVSWRGDDGPR